MDQVEHKDMLKSLLLRADDADPGSVAEAIFVVGTVICDHLWDIVEEMREPI